MGQLTQTNRAISTQLVVAEHDRDQRYVGEAAAGEPVDLGEVEAGRVRAGHLRERAGQPGGVRA